MSKVLRLHGRADWVPTDDALETADNVIVIKRENSIVLEYEADYYSYSATMNHVSDNIYQGEWQYYEHRVLTNSGPATCVLYGWKDKYIVMGDWSEEGIKYAWWAHLKPSEDE